MNDSPLAGFSEEVSDLEGCSDRCTLLGDRVSLFGCSLTGADSANELPAACKHLEIRIRRRSQTFVAKLHPTLVMAFGRHHAHAK